jgi:hypothetical protein
VGFHRPALRRQHGGRTAPPCLDGVWSLNETRRSEACPFAAPRQSGGPRSAATTSALIIPGSAREDNLPAALPVERASSRTGIINTCLPSWSRRCYGLFDIGKDVKSNHA